MPALSGLLSRSLRELADRARDGRLRGDLLDRSYAVLPPPRLRLAAAGRHGKGRDRGRARATRGEAGT
ncbi:hypothetical protein LUX12_07075 [Streptomyces somaliensis]|uniref:hypothetical protein n=1 Tax=Streptomyces somaliensis TaxID=78355 RepID=UPI0020CF241C|nr:hypothetical protein [Streptomyces somaliensis]MCP9944600.1 hypothetical protein [Streptomyces somaliensis]